MTVLIFSTPWDKTYFLVTSYCSFGIVPISGFCRGISKFSQSRLTRFAASSSSLNDPPYNSFPFTCNWVVHFPLSLCQKTPLYCDIFASFSNALIYFTSFVSEDKHKNLTKEEIIWIYKLLFDLVAQDFVEEFLPCHTVDLIFW